VSDIPELATVIGSAGERVARGDAPALTSALRRLHADPERRAQLGRDAQAAVQPYSIAASAERYAALYREVASQQAAARR
jgi:glycosyltransferase involved in cell wall biosynthesis